MFVCLCGLRMGDWLDLHAVRVNEWMRRKWLEYDMSYNVYIHYTTMPAEKLTPCKIFVPKCMKCTLGHNKNS